MVTRARSHPWEQTPLGPTTSWSASLRSAAALVLECRFPMTLLWGPDLRHIYNDAYVPILAGKHPSALGRPASAVWSEIWHIIGPQLQGVMDGSGGTWNEHVLLPIDRRGFLEEAYFTFSYSPVRGDAGEIEGVLVTVQETTAQVRGERQMRLLAELAAAMEDGDTEHEVLAAAARTLDGHREDVPFALLCTVDAGGRPRVAALAGFPPESGPNEELAAALLAAPAAVAFVDLPRGVPAGPWPHPPTRAAVLPLATEPPSFLAAALSPARPVDRDYEQLYRLIADQITRALARVERTELLEREQRARGEAETQRRQLRATFDQAPTLIAVFRGPDHVVDLANDLMCRAWGRRPEDVVGRAFFDAVPEGRDQSWRALLDGVYQRGEPFIGREIPAEFDRDGARHTSYYDFVWAPLREEGEVRGIINIATDVTDQVIARRELSGLREAAEAANRAKDEFLAMLGHELRNPLAPILTALQLLRLRGVKEVERERAVIERQVRHLVTLVDDLLDVARITRGKIELSQRVVEVDEVVTKAIEMSSPLLEQQRHQVRVDVPHSGLGVSADPDRLAQVVANILNNAAKYTEPGGLVEVTASREGDDVVLRVRDTGMGISPEILPHIFDLFVQQSQSLARSRGGLGLGLTIARSLVTLHGGSLSAESAGAGCGATFTVRLPHVAAPAPERAPQAPAHDSAAGVGRRVLVVDDNVDAAMMLSEMLVDFGCTVRTAHDGPTALEVVRTYQPDVALLDIGLPVMDGYELARRLTAHPDLRGLRLVAVTGYGQRQDRERSFAAGFHAHMVKPVDAGQLRELLGDVDGLAEPA